MRLGHGQLGGGWVFAPDYLPTGETLFRCGAPANSGGYCDKTNEALISKTLTSGNLQDLYRWQDYLATRLPVMWQPNSVTALTEIAERSQGRHPTERDPGHQPGRTGTS